MSIVNLGIKVVSHGVTTAKMDNLPVLIGLDYLQNVIRGTNSNQGGIRVVHSVMFLLQLTLMS